MPDAVRGAAASRPAGHPADRRPQGLARRVLRRSAAANGKRARPGIAALPDDALKPFARAELYTAKGSPKVELQALLRPCSPRRPSCPRPSSSLRLALAAARPANCRRSPGRGAHRSARQRAAPRMPRPVSRASPRPTSCGPRSSRWSRSMTGRGRSAVPASAADCCRSKRGPKPRIGSPGSITSAAATPTPAAWPIRGRPGAAGEWAAQAAWISGLASWRMNDCEAAARHFREVAHRPLGSASWPRPAHYWAARAEQACRRPQAGRAAAQGRRAVAGKLLRPARARNAGHGQARCPAGPLPRDRRGSRICPMSAGRCALAEVGEYRARRGDAPPPGQDRPGRRSSSP